MSDLFQLIDLIVALFSNRSYMYVHYLIRVEYHVKEVISVFIDISVFAI